MVGPVAGSMLLERLGPAAPFQAGAALSAAAWLVQPLGREFCHSATPPCTFTRCFNGDEQGGVVEMTELWPTAQAGGGRAVGGAAQAEGGGHRIARQALPAWSGRCRRRRLDLRCVR